MANPIKLVGIKDYEYYKSKGYKFVITSNYAYEAYLVPNSKKAKRVSVL